MTEGIATAVEIGAEAGAEVAKKAISPVLKSIATFGAGIATGVLATLGVQKIKAARAEYEDGEFVEVNPE